MMMPSVYDMASAGAAVAFLAWTLAVVALAKAMFASFPAAELAWWLHQRGSHEREELSRLSWEVQHRAVYDPDVIDKSLHAQKQNLTTAELSRKRDELQERARGSRLRRAGRYFASCFACQAFWSAVALFVWARWPEVGLFDILASCAAYSASAVVLATLVGAYAKTGEANSGRAHTEQQGGCPGCGG